MNHNRPRKRRVDRLDLFEELEHADGGERNSKIRPAGKVKLSDKPGSLSNVASLLLGDKNKAWEHKQKFITTLSKIVWTWKQPVRYNSQFTNDSENKTKHYWLLFALTSANNSEALRPVMNLTFIWCPMTRRNTLQWNYFMTVLCSFQWKRN